MCKRALIAGVGLLLCLGSRPAWAQSWSVQIDGVTEFNITVSGNGSSQKLKGANSGGAVLGVGTPYHVGFGLEGYGATFFPNTGGGSNGGGGGGPSRIHLDVNMADVYFDLPIPWIHLSLGTGWGQGQFSPNQFGGPGGSTKLETLNLWQFFFQFGIPLFSGLDVHVSYRQSHGHLIQRSDYNGSTSTDTLDFQGDTSSIGFRYTF